MHYTPCNDVLSAHAIPHIGSSSTFSFTSNYLASLFIFPLILLLISVLFSLSYIITLITSCICVSLNVFPSTIILDPHSNNFQEDAYSKMNWHERYSRRFLVFLFALFITNFFIWYGHAEFSTSYVSYNTDIIQVGNALHSIVSTSQNTLNDCFTLLNIANTSSQCGLLTSKHSFYSLIAANTTLLESSSASINSTSSTLYSYLTTFESSVESILLIKRLDYVDALVFCVIFVSAALYYYAFHYSKTVVFRVAIGVSWFVSLGILVISSLFTIVIVSKFY